MYKKIYNIISNNNVIVYAAIFGIGGLLWIFVLFPLNLEIEKLL